jgi:outer membrane protein
MTNARSLLLIFTFSFAYPSTGLVAAPGVTPGAAPGVTPGAAPGVTPGAAPGMSPGAAFGAAPRAGAGAAARPRAGAPLPRAPRDPRPRARPPADSARPGDSGARGDPAARGDPGDPGDPGDSGARGGPRDSGDSANSGDPADPEAAPRRLGPEAPPPRLDVPREPGAPVTATKAMSLAEAIRFARRHNLQLRASRVDEESAKVGRKLGWALLGPHFSFGVDFTFIGGDSTFDGASMGDTSSGFDINQIAELCQSAQDSAACLQWMQENGEYAGLLLGSAFSSFGAIGDIFNADTVKFTLGAAWQILNWSNLVNVKRLKISEKLSRAATRNTSHDVVTNVTVAYYQVLAAQESVRILQTISKATKEHLRQARALMAAGMGTKVDVLRWQAQVANDEQQLLQARQGVRSAKLGLNNLLGRKLTAPLRLVRPTALDDENLPAPKRVEEPQRDHPQLRLSRLNVRMKKVDHQGAKAAFLPTVTLSGGYNWQRFLPHEKVAEDTRWLGSWSVMLSLKVPLFDSMSKVYSMQMKELAVSKARLERRNLQRFLRQQVRTADLEVKSAYEKIRVARKQVRLAQEAHDSAENLYRAGNAKTTDVLDAQKGLIQAKFNLLNARFGYLMALAQRARAAGSLK